MEGINNLNIDELVVLGFLLKKNHNKVDIRRMLKILAEPTTLKERLIKIEQADMPNENQSFIQMAQKIIDPRIKQSMRFLEREVENKIFNFKDPDFKIILILDDLTYITKTLSLLLKNESFNIVTANSSLETLLLLNKIMPDIIISDVKLPDINGFDLGIIIREIKKNIPIIFMSAFVNPKDEKYNFIQGNKTLLNKPIKKDELLSTIREFLLKN